jgi:HSP20 family protein
MNLTPWKARSGGNGSNSLLQLRSEMDRMFDRFFTDPWGMLEPKILRESGLFPRLDLSETDTEVTVRTEIPGIDPKSLNVSISGYTLMISGEKKEEKEREGENFYHCERRFGSFRREVELPAGIDPDKVTAEYENGVATIRVAKKPTAKPKYIPVQTGKGRGPQPQSAAVGDPNKAPAAL